jgi:hypothetical protein
MTELLLNKLADCFERIAVVGRVLTKIESSIRWSSSPSVILSSWQNPSVPRWRLGVATSQCLRDLEPEPFNEEIRINKQFRRV